MKLFAITLIAACACACASNTPIQHQQSQTKPLDQSFYNPPRTHELIVQDDRKLQEREAIINEENAYWLSLTNITSKISQEALDIQICREVSKDVKVCDAMVARNCEVSMLIDSRGGRHDKHFCVKP